MLSHAPLSTTIRVTLLLVCMLLLWFGLNLLTRMLIGPLIMLCVLCVLHVSCSGLTPEKSAPENPGTHPQKGSGPQCFPGHSFQCMLHHCMSYFGNNGPWA